MLKALSAEHNGYRISERQKNCIREGCQNVRLRTSLRYRQYQFAWDIFFSWWGQILVSSIISFKSLHFTSFDINVNFKRMKLYICCQNQNTLISECHLRNIYWKSKLTSSNHSQHPSENNLTSLHWKKVRAESPLAE